MSSLRSSVVYAAGAQYVIQALQLLSVLVIARVLTPEEIGIFSVASAAVLIAMELRSLGVGNYIIREETVTTQTTRAATGLMLLVSWGLGIGIVLSAGGLAVFYREPALEEILHIIAFSFFIGPFSVVAYAHLARNMQFKELFIARVSGAVGRFGGMVGFVLGDLGPVGLAYGTALGAVVEFAALNLLRPAGVPWLPSFQGMGAILKFGALTSTAGLMSRFGEVVPDLILGRVGSMRDVGIFSRGMGLILFLDTLISKAVGPVVLPYLSAEVRQGRSLAAGYLRAVGLQCVVSWPLFAVVTVASGPMIEVMFGPQWGESVPIAAALAIWGLLRSTHIHQMSALMAVELEGVLLLRESVVFASRALAVLGGALVGREAAAIALVGAGVVEFAVSAWICVRFMGVEWAALVRSLAAPTWIAGLCGGSVYFLYHEVGANQWLLVNQCLSIGGLAASLWLSAMVVSRHPLLAAVTMRKAGH